MGHAGALQPAPLSGAVAVHRFAAFHRARNAARAFAHPEAVRRNRRGPPQGFSEVPPRVEYRLTPLGRSLEEPILGLGLWAERHAGELAAAGKRAARAKASRPAR